MRTNTRKVLCVRRSGTEATRGSLLSVKLTLNRQCLLCGIRNFSTTAMVAVSAIRTSAEGLRTTAEGLRTSAEGSTTHADAYAFANLIAIYTVSFMLD